ncbi:RNA editing complex protein MP90 [Trypanosoma theileri]|uniref:RNA editing complex protein MP90 n=1 Tax=Trypanosoma theileri TaxID=67003 RepID=A0A1X0NWF0_9TRYP|nr:RNA editing complex protein MP90 [Trypanosoma theileri]ORC89002.1 RNA editing complex protein MP90 [Trypanosoma theileri]
MNSGEGSNANGGGSSTSAPRLSRNSRSFMHKKLQKGSKKEDGEKNKYQKAAAAKYQRSLQCLTTFDCPVCRMSNSVRVDLNTKEREAVVRCTYCMSLRPRPVDLPYPYTTPFVPKLENRADVFFKFNELYRGIEKKVHSSVNNIPTTGEGNDDDDDEVLDSGVYTGDGVLAISSNILATAASTSAPENMGDKMAEAEMNKDGEEKEEEEEAEEKDDEGEVADVHAFFGDSDED